MQVIPFQVRQLWSSHEIRLLVLLSLILQIFLIFLAPLRKRSANRILSLLLWSFYLSADYVATLALGNLLNMQTQDTDESMSGDIMAFWAPFLLLHLGGPDSITSYSLEDNELWWRHLLGLVVQVSVAVLIFLESLPSPLYWKPAILVFIVGFLKFGERTLALRSASMDELRDSMVHRPDPGPNYPKFMEEYVSRREAGLNAYIKREDEPLPPDKEAELATIVLSDVKVIHKGYHFFTIFKRIAVDLVLTFRDRLESQPFFWSRTPAQAFRLVEVELSFLYDILHTKALHVHSPCGRFLRGLSFGLIFLALVLFHQCDKQGYKRVDITITYVLLSAALVLEIMSIVLLLVSDWMIVWLDRRHMESLAAAIIRHVNLMLPNGKPRWSNSMRQYDLIRYFRRRPVSNIFLQINLPSLPHLFAGKLKAAKVNIIEYFPKVKETWRNCWYISSLDVPDYLKKLIFEELKRKSKSAQNSSDLNGLRSCRGELALKQQSCINLMWSVQKEFDESIMLWHIATTLCNQTEVSHSEQSGDERTYYRENNNKSRGGEVHVEIENSNSEEDQIGNDEQHYSTKLRAEISKMVSNYMMYLLVLQPAMMPPGIWKIRFQDTCAEAEKFFEAEEPAQDDKHACLLLLDVVTEIEPIEVKGDRSKSVLFDACRLAKELKQLNADKRWRVASAVWLELLGYAAINCGAYSHAKQLSSGGELLSHIWFLMVHMGIGEQYRIESGHARVKLIVDK
ncbi:hypothetical protein LUZ62_066528 [Rhynchospora pubera]|uniref:DUF4220 domain-containing protein n=1 Tax=Rhynchospora pubera TaxID=906938 RepID=A0AAV8ERX1_9POAL|nr:hypothetical protein LUZ62_066528 [Rhynchospora pubera]